VSFWLSSVDFWAHCPFPVAFPVPISGSFSERDHIEDGMVFKWGQRSKSAGDGSAQSIATPATPGKWGVSTRAAGTQLPLPPEELRRTSDPAAFGFTSTADIAPIRGLIGQERALAAIAFGTDMASMDYNIFVLGPPASGKRTALKTQLLDKATRKPRPDDWVYVFNFQEPSRPRSLRLPSGRARSLARAMIGAIDELRGIVPALVEGEDYQARRRAIDASFQGVQEQALETLTKKAAGQNIALLRTPQGFAFAPMHEGRVVKPDTFNALPDAMRNEKQAQLAALETELAHVLERLPKSEKERRVKVAELNTELARAVVTAALEDIASAFTDVPAVIGHLNDAGEDLVRNIAIFLPSGEDETGPISAPADGARDPRYRRYMVNVMVGNAPPAEGDAQPGAPVIEETNPVYGNLLGRIEHVTQGGALMTDFLLIKPGALHRANGGYLMVDARRLVQSPFAYEALKRALKAREIRIEPPQDAAGIGVVPQTLEPEPTALDVKVIMTGEREAYYALAQNDPDFLGLFKVQADFDDAIPRSPENDRAYAGVVASIVDEHKLRPVEASGVARIIEEGSRLANDRDKISVEIGYVSDLVREADYWAGKAGRAAINHDHVETAVAAQIKRADRIKEHAQETVERGVVLVDTEGAETGQVNGLAVMQVGNFSFGRPSRITARVAVGQGRIVDIEREAKLGGASHTKGMMILQGFIAGRFAQSVPLALSATLTFEQSYGGVDGDSASSTEIYALLSALANVPIQQGLAVTGSVNQLGDVQAIGGVNHKIEGFYDLCASRGLTGQQGVLIPQSNVQHLMLREDIVTAAAAGNFSVFAVETIDQGIEILTGIPAGVRGSDGAFPADSINGLVQARLMQFAEQARAYGRAYDGRTLG
jgi:lon-related putative ATP-dependent protease